MEFSNAALRYLVAVYELSDGGSAVRSVDIARMMEVSPASVVHMMGVLSQGGFVRSAESALFWSLAARFRSASVEDWPIKSSMLLM